MRLLIIGTLKGQLTTATKIAVDRGASVTHAVDIEQGLKVLRARGADLIMADVTLDIRDLVTKISDERMHAPVVACGVETNARAAVDAIHAGAAAPRQPRAARPARRNTSRCRQTPS